jgi:hypothetical protein
MEERGIMTRMKSVRRARVKKWARVTWKMWKWSEAATRRAT